LSIHEWNAFGEYFSYDIPKVEAISVSMAAISNPVSIHGVWLVPIDQFREQYLHKKYSIGDKIQFNTSRLIMYLKLVFTNLSLEANEVEISTG
jgi:hypothetical protein